MKLSIFTPTHLPDFLCETYHSLLRQSYTDWEWVLVPNGSKAFIPDSIRSDNRVKVVSGGKRFYNIGALKRLACDNATGYGFIELDHDDLLFPGNSLAAIAAAFKRGGGFVFSDAAVFNYGDENKYGKFKYAESHGWSNYPVNVYGRELLATRAFEPSPRSLCHIHYAPDHVRCWSREAYYAAGGHNRELPVADDQELMIKTYLTGLPFEHTGGCHYLYRMYAQNTVKSRNTRIQELAKEYKEKYTEDLIREWATREDHEVLDVQELRREGWKCDRDLHYGFGDSKYGIIEAHDFLQWLDGTQVVEFMNAAYDALVPGGYLMVSVPDARHEIGYADPAYKTYYSTLSMLPYTYATYAKANGNVTCRFQEVHVDKEFPSEWHEKHEFQYLRFHLCALKGQRQPGQCHI
jgi:glycosyltransferase involved in cell wall biosynthesis|tara:strand:- start:37137 stop:38357 length:1221 start_codon:yes stop_codon:yes gene_type:complete